MTAPRSAVCRHCRTPLEAGQAFCTRCGAAIRVPTSGEDPLRDRLEAVFGAELVIEREIGRGAMGAVFAAFDPALQRRVAVKALLPEVELDSAIAERFIREARIAAALQHANIVSVYGVRSGDGVRAIVMQYVEGRGLDRVVAETPHMPIPIVAKILADVSAALQHAHDRRVIHRDVKPANVLMGYDGVAMVTDFGIARQFGATRITEEGLVMGTLPYISPEAATGGEATLASDQYSLGIMAFEMYVGVRPFLGSAQELLYAHANVAPPSLGLARPDLPPSAAAAVQRMLEKDPDARWQSLADVERVFRALVIDADAATRQMAQLSQPVARARSGVQRAMSTRASVPVQAKQTVPVAARAPAVPAVPAVVADAGATPPTVATRPARPSKSKFVATGIALAGVLVAAIVWKTSGSPSERGRDATPSPAPTAAQDSPAAAHPGSPAASAQSAPAPQQSNTSARTTGDSGVRRPTVIATAPRPDSARLVAAPPAAETAAVTRVLPAQPPEQTRTPQRAESPPVAPKPTADNADARKLGFEFAALVNKGRWRELELLPGTGGDANARTNLIRLVRVSRDIAAGLRAPSLPAMTADGFESEFILDVEVTTGGKIQSTPFTIVFNARHDESGWHLAGWRVTGAV